MGIFGFELIKSKDLQKLQENRQIEKIINLFNSIVFEWTRGMPIISVDNLTDLVNTYKSNSIVYSLVDWKANKASEIKPCLYAIKDPKGAKEYRKFNGKYTDGYELKQLKNLKERSYEEIDLNCVSNDDLKFGILKKLFRMPNPQTTWKLFVYQYCANKDLGGFSAIWGNRLQSGVHSDKFYELYVLPSHLVDIIGGTMLEPIQSYRLRAKTYNKDFLAKDVLLISNFSFNYETSGSHLYGQSRVKAAMTEVKTYLAARLRELYGFQTGDATSIISLDDYDSIQSFEGKSDVEKQDFIDGIRKKINQTDKKGMAFLPLKIKVDKIDSPLKDANTIETQKQIREIICGAFHIAPSVIGSQDASTYNNMKEAVKMSLRDAVFPCMRDLNESMQYNIIEAQYRDLNLDLQFDYDVFDEVGQDIEIQANALSKMNFLSTNEKRAWLEFSKRDEEKADIPEVLWDTDLGGLSTLNDGSYD